MSSIILLRHQTSRLFRSQFKSVVAPVLFRFQSSNGNTNSTAPNYETSEAQDSHQHFRVTSHQHPLKPALVVGSSAEEKSAGDHTGIQQNHIWSSEELNEAMSTLYRHQPKTIADKIVNKAVSLHYE